MLLLKILTVAPVKYSRSWQLQITIGKGSYFHGSVAPVKYSGSRQLQITIGKGSYVHDSFISP